MRGKNLFNLTFSHLQLANPLQLNVETHVLRKSVKDLQKGVLKNYWFNHSEFESTHKHQAIHWASTQTWFIPVRVVETAGVHQFHRHHRANLKKHMSVIICRHTASHLTSVQYLLLKYMQAWINMLDQSINLNVTVQHYQELCCWSMLTFVIFAFHCSYMCQLHNRTQDRIRL